MLFQRILGNCCPDESSKLPVLPPRRFESIPDETRYESKTEINVLEQLNDYTKPVFRNRMILLGCMALFVLYFQLQNKKK